MRYRTFLQFVEKLYKTGCLGDGRENPTRVPAPKASSESKPECLSPSPRQPVLLHCSKSAAQQLQAGDLDSDLQGTEICGRAGAQRQNHGRSVAWCPSP